MAHDSADLTDREAATAWGRGRPRAHDGAVGRLSGANTLRSVLALGLLITLCASANAATVRRSKSPAGHLRPVQRVTVPKGFAVPGWTDEETRMSAPHSPCT
jgi:hypothetical protein